MCKYAVQNFRGDSGGMHFFAYPGITIYQMYYVVVIGLAGVFFLPVKQAVAVCKSQGSPRLSKYLLASTLMYALVTFTAFAFFMVDRPLITMGQANDWKGQAELRPFVRKAPIMIAEVGGTMFFP